MTGRSRTLGLALAVALAPACKFASGGLGDESGVAPASESGSATGDASTGDASTAPVTAGGPSPSGDDASGSGPTGDPATSEPTSGEPPTTGPPPTTEPPPPGCGDGNIDPDEQCDDGADNGAGNACTPVCSHNTCGDGYPLAGAEACDDGNDDVTDMCIACELAVCGDGHVYKNVESCDGAGESADCDADCSTVSCGDGTVNAAAGELCDLGPGNGAYGGPCNDTCDGPGPTCGDGMVDAPDETCDPAIPPVGHVVCINACKSTKCEDNWGNCDGDAGDGCETNLLSDKHHCGDCETDCLLLACKNGKCSL
ncbi:MAG: hypothetical protein JNL82_36495 [Myxococcales bacterium]|nr:hypothetical protein [Myxococcales bacterium]